MRTYFQVFELKGEVRLPILLFYFSTLEEMMDTKSVKIDKKLHHALKVHCAKEDVPMADFINKLIMMALIKTSK